MAGIVREYLLSCLEPEERLPESGLINSIQRPRGARFLVYT
jgi:hypothetical protein